MSNIIDHLPLTDFGLDFDSAPRYVSKGDSKVFFNVLKGEDGNYGELTNLKGNRKVTYQLGSSNTYFVAWSCYDPLTRNVYFYIFSQPFDTTGSGDYEHDNRFIRFNEDSEVITTMFYDTKNYFGVDPSIRVKDSFVLGDWLFYNPQTSEPKIIDLVRILNYTTYAKYDATLTYTYGQKVTYFGGVFNADEPIAIGEDPVNYDTKWTRIGDSYQSETDIEFDSEFRYAFNQIKHIPVYRPVCNYATDTDKNANNVRGKLFRFSHRYKYFDNSYSRYGAYSDITLPQYDEYYNGEVPDDLDLYNCIDVKVPLHSAALIKEVDIIFQETGGDWKRAKIVNRQDIVLLDQLYYTYRFYNTDSAFDQIDDDHFYEAYDDLPRTANSMEIINKNILTFGGVTEGFDNLPKNEIDVTLTPEIEDIVVPGTLVTVRRNLLNPTDITNTWNPSTLNWMTNINFSTWYPSGVIAGDYFDITIDGIAAEPYLIQPADVFNIGAFCAAIETWLQAQYPSAGWSLGATTITAMDAINITVCQVYNTGAAEQALTKKRGFKTGAWHPFCIFYYDEALRRWDAQTSKDHPDGIVTWSADGTTVYIPMFGEYSPNDGSTAHKWNINWSVNHLPPIGAKWWRWGKATTYPYFVQYTITNLGNVGATSATEPINTTWVDITPLQTIKTTVETDWNKYPNSVIEAYAFTKGDRIRFITEASTVGNELGAVIDGVYDYGIISFDEDTNRIYVQEFLHPTFGEDSLVEIYTPIKSDVARDFYEFGELMPIIDDSDNIPVHGCGNTGTLDQDTIFGNPATGVFKAGDVYHILRTPSKPIDGIKGWFHESQWYSDFYDSDDWDKGRPGVETNFGERFLNIVRHSKQYLQNTLINGLSTFWGDQDYKKLNDVFGDILRIIENGDTLKVYQRKKPSSILIGRTEYVDAEGNANIVSTSDRILGAIRYSTTNYGTEFPESITRNNRYIYGFDIYNGVMWRDSANGIFPISGKYESADGGNYKMETYFKQKAKDLLVSGIEGVDVETAWDERHKNLYVIFRDIVTEANNEALMFHEPSNRWIGFTNMDQTPDEGWTQMIELEWSVLRGFDGGMGYEFDLDTRFAIFNVVTPHDEIEFTPKQDLAMTLFAPTIVIDCTVEPDLLTLQGTLPPPDVILPYVEITPNAYNWAAADVIGTTFTVTSSPDTCVLTAIPSWLWVDYNSNIGSHLNVGAVISTGSVLYIYPRDVNLGGAILSGVETLVTVYDSTTGCGDSIIVTRSAALANPTVRVLTLGGDSNVGNALQTVAGGGTCVAGSTTVDITFSCDHKDLTDATNFMVFATVEIRDAQTNGNLMDTGSGEVNTNEVNPATALSITNLSAAVQSGYWVYVYLSAYRLVGGGDPPVHVDVTASASLNSFALSLPSPTVVITVVSPDTIGLQWADNDITTQNFSIDTGDSVQTRVSYAPSWITILDSGGNDLKGGHYINDEEVCTMNPTNVNLGGQLDDDVTFVNEYGDTNTIHVRHLAKAGVTPITLSISGSDTTDLAFMTGIGREATLTNNTALIALRATFNSPLYSEGGSYTVYWYATKGSIFAGRGDFPNWDEIEVNVQLVLDAVAVTSDTIIIYFAGNYI